MSNHLLLLDPLHIFSIENMASYMVAVVRAKGYINSNLVKLTNDLLTLPLWLLDVDSHSNYSCQLVRSLFSENKC